VSEPTIIEYLVADHTRLHGLLERSMTPPQVDLEAYAAFRRGLLRHIKIEEKVLFPAVRGARGGLSLDRAHELRIDHAALTSLLVSTPDLELCREILALLSTHDAKEEGASGIYEECERWLNKDELILLAEQARSLPEVRVARYLDRPGVYRTAESALASAGRLRLPMKDQR
jgi:hypothetical protein